MSTQYLLLSGDVNGVTNAFINDFNGLYVEIDSTDTELVLDKTATSLNHVLSIADNLEIFIKVQKYLVKFLQYTNNLHIACETMDLLEEIHISHPNISLGLIEKHRGYLSAEIHDYFLDFVILNCETLLPDKIRRWKEKNTKVYVQNVNTVLQVKKCTELIVDGIITHNTSLPKICNVLH